MKGGILFSELIQEKSMNLDVRFVPMLLTQSLYIHRPFSLPTLAFMTINFEKTARCVFVGMKIEMGIRMEMAETVFLQLR